MIDSMVRIREQGWQEDESDLTSYELLGGGTKIDRVWGEAGHSFLRLLSFTFLFVFVLFIFFIF